MALNQLVLKKNFSNETIIFGFFHFLIGIQGEKMTTLISWKITFWHAFKIENGSLNLLVQMKNSVKMTKFARFFKDFWVIENI